MTDQNPADNPDADIAPEPTPRSHLDELMAEFTARELTGEYDVEDAELVEEDE